jgi:transcriptional regulator with XRE-family HTH domain
MPKNPATSLPERSLKIIGFRQALKLTQGALGKRLKTSAMAVSRWERGETEPAAGSYIRLGNLAGDPLCWFFLARAGLSTADVMRVLPTAGRRLRQGRIASVNVVHAGAGRAALNPVDFVAIPLLPVRTATAGANADEVADLDQIKPEGMWAAPRAMAPQSGVHYQPSCRRLFDVAAHPGWLHRCH